MRYILQVCVASALLITSAPADAAFPAGLGRHLGEIIRGHLDSQKLGKEIAFLGAGSTPGRSPSSDPRDGNRQSEQDHTGQERFQNPREPDWYGGYFHWRSPDEWGAGGNFGGNGGGGLNDGRDDGNDY